MSLSSYSCAGSEYNFNHREYDEDLLVPGTDEYKQARRRRQNRESASRVRAQKKEKLDVIQVRLNALSDGNSRMEKEILQLRAENELLRAEATLTNKESYAYVKIAVLLGVLGLFSIQSFGLGSDSEKSSGTWFNTIFLGIIMIILMMK